MLEGNLNQEVKILCRLLPFLIKETAEARQRFLPNFFLVRENGELLPDRLIVFFAHEIPVDDVVEGFDIFRTTVLIMEIVGVLPDVEAE